MDSELERARFEEWCASQFQKIRTWTKGDGTYHSSTARRAWDIWQASRALKPSRVEEAREYVLKCALKWRGAPNTENTYHLQCAISELLAAEAQAGGAGA